jgi:hypothetical protein
MAEYVSQESNEAEQNLLEADVQQGVQRDITIRQELEFLNRRPASLATEPEGHFTPKKRTGFSDF